MPWTELPHRGTVYVQVFSDTARRLVRFRRSDLAIKIDEAEHTLWQFSEDLERLLPTSSRKGYRLLVDTRDAPRASDPELEGKVLSIISPVMASFACVAVVLRTPIGVLQMRRLLRTWPARAEVFMDEGDATVWLLRQEAGGPESAR